MLKITIPAIEKWDEKNEVFVNFDSQELKLEHSLVSISKWEAKWHKPFLSKEQKSYEEIIDYIRCMTISQNINPDYYNYLSDKNVEEINAYINDPMTATTINTEQKGKQEIITSEIIYYWMIAFNIPVDFQKWHINRLLTLIRICDIKNDTNQKKMPKSEILARNRALNEARRKRYNTRG